MAEEIERIYVIPLKKTGFKSSSAAPSAIKRVKSFLTKHMKVKEDEIWIDDSLNEAIWNKGKYRMSSKIRVRAVKFEDGVVEAYLPELEFKKSRRELLKEEREKKEPILKKEEYVGADEEAGETADGEEYKVSPAADGEVKIKKKRPSKKTKEAKTEDKKTEKTKKKSREKEKKETKTGEKIEKPLGKKDKTAKSKKKEEKEVKTKSKAMGKSKDTTSKSKSTKKIISKKEKSKKNSE